jgi:hypothetical protein
MMKDKCVSGCGGDYGCESNCRDNLTSAAVDYCGGELLLCRNKQEQDSAKYGLDDAIETGTAILEGIDPLNDFEQCGVGADITKCEGEDPSHLKGDDIATVVSEAVNKFVFPIALILLLLLIIWGGVEILIASTSGQQNKIDMGKKRVTAAIVGFILLFRAYGLLQFIETILKLKE